MSHIAEHLIEAYVRHPDDLNSAAHQSIVRHLEECNTCRSIAEYLRTFYGELDTLGDKVSPQVEKWIAGHFPRARVIPLYPFRPEPNASFARNAHVVVLAAMTHASPAPRFQTVATLASAQKDVLLRLLRDNETDSYRLYILSDDPCQRKHAVVSFPDLALEVVTDDKGQAQFQLSDDKAPKSWDSLPSVLRLPVCEIRISAEQLRHAASTDSLTIEESAVTEYAIRISYSDNTLALEAQPRRQEVLEIALAVIQGGDDQTLAIPLRGGKGSVHLAPLPEMLTFCLYC